jgi:hypothetical protein
MRSLEHHVSSRSEHIVVFDGVNRALRAIVEIVSVMGKIDEFVDITYLSNTDKPHHCWVMWSLFVEIHLIGMT